MNAFCGIPNDEDLRRAYFWESRRTAAVETAAYNSARRKHRLNSLWCAHWYATVNILLEDEETEDLDWFEVFGVVVGHRFVWWISVQDFDSGEPPSGKIFLSGHSGLTTPSPIELRHIGTEELDRIVCLFGRGADSQQRVTILTTGSDQRIQLEAAIGKAKSGKAD